MLPAIAITIKSKKPTTITNYFDNWNRGNDVVCDSCCCFFSIATPNHLPLYLPTSLSNTKNLLMLVPTTIFYTILPRCNRLKSLERKINGNQNHHQPTNLPRTDTFILRQKFDGGVKIICYADTKNDHLTSMSICSGKFRSAQGPLSTTEICSLGLFRLGCTE